MPHRHNGVTKDIRDNSATIVDSYEEKVIALEEVAYILFQRAKKSSKKASATSQSTKKRRKKQDLLEEDGENEVHLDDDDDNDDDTLYSNLLLDEYEEERKLKAADHEYDCICGMEERNILAIQCDECYSWQHMMCEKIDPKSHAIDDPYTCTSCRKSEENSAKQQKDKQSRAARAKAREKLKK